MVVVENTPKVHNMVVCTLCSCYPWPVLGLPPVWYKSAAYRSRAVIDPRGVLREFGLELPEEVEVRVCDSTAELRYLVLPRTAGRQREIERRRARRAGDARRHDRRGQGDASARRRRMNGVHDMGGMQDMGPVERERNEPVFHERWEGRVFAMKRALGAWRKWNLDASRHSRELIPPADYLRMSYYEKWLTRADRTCGQERPGHARRDRKRQARRRVRRRRLRRSRRRWCRQ